MTQQPIALLEKTWHCLVLGRAGLDLYPQVDGSKTRNAKGFSADMGVRVATLQLPWAVLALKLAY